MKFQAVEYFLDFIFFYRFYLLWFNLLLLWVLFGKMIFITVLGFEEKLFNENSGVTFPLCLIAQVARTFSGVIPSSVANFRARWRRCFQLYENFTRDLIYVNFNDKQLLSQTIYPKMFSMRDISEKMNFVVFWRSFIGIAVDF